MFFDEDCDRGEWCEIVTQLPSYNVADDWAIKTTEPCRYYQRENEDRRLRTEYIRWWLDTINEYKTVNVMVKFLKGKYGRRRLETHKCRADLDGYVQCPRLIWSRDVKIRYTKFYMYLDEEIRQYTEYMYEKDALELVRKTFRR